MANPWDQLSNSAIGQAARGIGINLDPTLGSLNTGAGLPWSAGNQNSGNLQTGAWAPAAAEAATGLATGLPGLGATTQSMYQGMFGPSLMDYEGQNRANKAQQDQDKIRKEQDAAGALAAQKQADEQKRREQAAWQTQKTNEANTQADLEKSWRSAFSQTGRRMYA